MSTIKFDFRHNYRRGERREAASAAYQWDLGHEAEIYVPATATYEVHYTRPGWSETEDYAVESCTAVADGGYKLIAHIPNKYFETSGELGLYIVGSADDHVITTYEGYITILGRKEPEDYTDDDPENGAETIIEKAREYANQSEAWAVGEIDGEPVPSTEPQYHNNAKYYLEQAAAEATAAAASAAAAAQSAAAVDFASIAPQFSASTAYSAGDYVYYNELLYCFTADHAAGSWTGTDATQVTVGEELDDLKGAMSNVEGTLITDTASGAIATFPDGADNFPVKDLKVWIEPVQDLHGYDHPWPEGGGKNIFNYDAWRPDIKRGTAVYENNGVTLTATSNDCYTDYGSTYSSDANQTERNQSQISSDNAKLWADLEKKTHADRDKYASKSSNSSSNIDSKSSGKNTQSNYGREDLSCPICEGLHDFENADYKDAKYRDETIAWNKWRSNLQNRIMDDSDIDADYGTIFYFSFTVDNNRNISNVRVISTNLWDKESTEVVRRAIIHLKGKPILNFPPNTNRSSIKFTGGFVIGTTSQYSTPGDYNDFEHVRLQY